MVWGEMYQVRYQDSHHRMVVAASTPPQAIQAVACRKKERKFASAGKKLRVSITPP